MKFITAVCRILVGALFIFSGFIKSNDPKGFGIKLEDYFNVFAQDAEAKQDSIILTINDNRGNSKTEILRINIFDTAKTVEFNTSSSIVEMENPLNDSMVSIDSAELIKAYVVVDGNKVFEAGYHTDSNNNKINFTIKARIGDDSTFVKTFAVGSKKIQSSNLIDVKPFIKQNSWLNGFFKGMIPYSVLISILICVLEIMLGFAVLIGWKPQPVSWLMLLMIIFFTILTWYSWYYNKVTDCGCFGDFIKLKPFTSFIKDIILLVLILVIFVRRKHIKPLFSPPFGARSVMIVTLASLAFAVYCNSYLPIIDFLPYEKGNDIKLLMTPPKGERVMDSFVYKFVYIKDGKTDTISDLTKLPKAEDGWKFVDRPQVLAAKATWKSPIHDFNLMQRPDSDINPQDSVLNQNGYKLLIIAKDLDNSHPKAWEKIKATTSAWINDKLPVYAFTSTIFEEADKFSNEMQLPFKFYAADQTLLKTMVRSNPGVILMKNSTIVDKWSFRNVPSFEKLKKMMK